MNNVDELRKNLVILYEDVQIGDCEIEKAKVLVSASNSILKSIAVEVEFMKFVGDKDRIIDFLS